MAEKTPSSQKGKSETKSAQSEVAQKKEGSGFSLEDNRAETNVQLKVKEGMDSRALSAPDLTGNKSFTIQKKAGPTVIRPTSPIATSPAISPGNVQLKGKSPEESELPVQASANVEAAQFAGAGESSPPPSESSSNSGLPQNLKSGVEKLSGQSMSDVTVHQNSEKPAQLNAHAYAKGSDIHLGPGQEKHLPHEAWHVAQQKQGRVQPTKQLKGKVPVNDDKGLEQEADVMGAKALEVGRETVQANADQPLSAIGNTVQLENGTVTNDNPAAVENVPTNTDATAAAETVPEPNNAQAQNTEAAAVPPSPTRPKLTKKIDSLTEEGWEAHLNKKKELSKNGSKSTPKPSLRLSMPPMEDGKQDGEEKQGEDNRKYKWSDLEESWTNEIKETFIRDEVGRWMKKPTSLKERASSFFGSLFKNQYADPSEDGKKSVKNKNAAPPSRISFPPLKDGTWDGDKDVGPFGQDFTWAASDKSWTNDTTREKFIRDDQNKWTLKLTETGAGSAGNNAESEGAVKNTAEKIDEFLKKPEPSKFTKRAIIITPYTGLRKLDDSKKIYEGLKAEEKLAREAEAKLAEAEKAKAAGTNADNVPVEGAGAEANAGGVPDGGTKETAPDAIAGNELGAEIWSELSKTKKKKKTADQEIKSILDSGVNKELPDGTGFTDTLKRVFGVGKKTLLTLAPALDPKKQGFVSGIPVLVDESSKIAGYVAVKFDMDGIQKYQKRDFTNFGIKLDKLIKKGNPKGEGLIPFNRLATPTIDMNNTARVRIGAKPKPKDSQVDKGSKVESAVRISYPPLENGAEEGDKKQGADGQVYTWSLEAKSWTNESGEVFVKDDENKWINKPSPPPPKESKPPTANGEKDAEEKKGEDNRKYRWSEEDKSWTNDIGDVFVRDKKGAWTKKEKSLVSRAGAAIASGGAAIARGAQKLTTKLVTTEKFGIKNIVANSVNSGIDKVMEQEKDWDVDANYTKANIVLLNNKKYKALTDNSGKSPDSSTEDWEEVKAGSLETKINKIKEDAKDVPVLNKLGLKVLPGGVRLIPGQGLFASFRASYNFGDEIPNELAITPNLMLNMQDSEDWHVEYLGATLEVPEFSLGSDETVKVDVALGTLSHEPTDGGSIFGIENGTIAASFLDQKVSATIKKATFNTAATSEKFNLELAEISADLKLLNTQLKIKVVEPSYKNGELNFRSAEGTMPSVTPFEGVNFTNVHVMMAKAEEGNTIAGTANFKVTNEYIENASGKLGIYKNGKNKSDFSLTDGNVVANIYDQKLTLSGITYDSAKEPGVINLTQGKLNLNLDNPIHPSKITGEFAINNAKLAKHGFTFDNSTARFGDIFITDGAVFKDTNATLVKEKTGYKFDGNARFQASGDGYFQSATGLLSINSAPSKDGSPKTLYSLTDGSIKGNIVGFDFNITGISLDSDTKTLAADWAGLEVEPFGDGDKIDVGITKITVNKDGFNFESAEAKLPDYNITDDWKLTGIHGGIRKNSEKNWEYFAAASIGNSVGADLGNGIIIKSASGTFEIVKQKGASVPSFNLLGGQLKADINGSTLDIEKLAFTENKLQVTKASLELVMPELTSGKPKAIVENLVIGDDGIENMEGKLDLSSLGKIDQGPLSVEPKSIDVLYNDESFLLSATGSAKLVNVLPVIPDVGVAGTFGYDFKKKSSAFEVDAAGISINVPSPLAGVKLPDNLPGVNGIWPLTIGFSVPVVPTVSVNLSLEVGGGVSFGDTIKLGAKVDRKLLTLSATMSVNPQLHIAVVASATAGLPGIGLTVGLKGLAGMRFEGPDHLKLRLAKTFVIGKGSVPPAKDKISPENISKSKSDQDGFTTSGKGEIVGALQAFVRGYALTFKKEYTKTLAEASVGKFEITNGGFKFDPPEEALDEEGVKQTAEEAKEEEAKLKAERKAEKERIDLGYSKLTNDEILAKISGGKRLSSEQLKFTVREFKSKGRRENSTTAEDLNWIAEINYERIDWQRLSDLEPIEKWPDDKPKKESNSFFSKSKDTQDYALYKKRVKPTATAVTNRNRKILAQSIHTKKGLAEAYENQIKLATRENQDDIKATLVYHNQLLEGYKQINVLKNKELRAVLLSGEKAENTATVRDTWLGSIAENEKLTQSFSDLAATIPPVYQELNSKKKIVFKERTASTTFNTGAAAAADAAENEEAARQNRFEEEQKALGLELYKGEWMTNAEKAAVIAEEAQTNAERTALDAAVEAAEGKTGEEKEAALQVINERKEALAAKLKAPKDAAASKKALAKAEGKKAKQAAKLAERNKYAEKRKAEALEEKNKALAAAQAARAAKTAKAVAEAQPTPLAPVN